MTEDIRLSEIYQLSPLAPQSIQVLMQGLDFLFLRYAQDKWWSHGTILDYIKRKWGYSAFLQEIYGDVYNWESTEVFTLTSLKQFLDTISEIGDCLFQKHLTQEDWNSFRRNGGDSAIWFAGKKYFHDENIQTGDIVFLEAFLRYHLVDQWIQLTESYKDEVDEFAIRATFSRDLQSFMRTILIPSVALFDMRESSELIQRILFLLSKAQELPIVMIREFNTRLESMSPDPHIEERSVQEELMYLGNVIQHLITSSCGVYGTMEFTRFRVQTVLIWEKNIDDPAKCLIKLLPSENFYFQKDEETVSEYPEEFPVQGNMLSNKNLIIGPKDCNIFDPSWNKVFWWDMSQSDIEKIQWTHYILTQSEWWSDVPDFLKGNIRSIGPTKDPFSPGYMENPITWLPIQIPNDVQWVHPDYVRMMAKAKIENGKYIENKRTIVL